MARRRRSRKPFIGDQILACFTMLQCVGCVGALSFFGFFAKSIAASMKDEKGRQLEILPGMPSVLDKIIGTSPSTYIVIAATVAAILTLLSRSIWLGQKWALWFMFLTHVPGAILGAMSGDLSTSSIGIGVTIYTFLRISGKAGPKL